MRRFGTGVLVAAVVLAAGACSSGASKSATTPPAPVSTTTTTVPVHLPGHSAWTQTFVDPTRPTVPAAGPRLNSRTLVTAIYRPNGRGPFPLIVFAHGYGGHPEKFSQLFSVWADAGFAVVAPAFPLTNDHVPAAQENAGDVAQQPGDLAFVLDNVLALDKDAKSRLYGAIDRDRIGVGGLSLGGLTVYLDAYGPKRDNRIKAVEVLDGFNSGAVIDGHVPILIAHSDTDPAIPYASALHTYDSARPPAWFVTLHGASHASQWENTVTPYDHIAERLTTDFWEGTLGGDAAALARLQRDATVRGLSSIVTKQ